MSHRTAALAALLNRPLAWERAALEAALDSVRAAGDAPVQAAVGRRSAGRTPNSRVGVLPLVGPITYRPSYWSMVLGGTDLTSYQQYLRELRTASEIEAILTIVDSFGGEVTALQETAYQMRETRRVKPIIALIDCNAASAAYWLASQADEIVMTPSSQVGSVGVFCLHVDASQALDRAGIRPTYIFAGKYKVEGNSESPLADDALQHMQSVVDRTHDQFVSDIVAGRGRGLTADRVKKTFGEGRMIHSAEDAIRRGMADRLFPTSDLALSYAVSYASRLAIKADRDYVDGVLLERGDREAIDRISTRAAAFNTERVAGQLPVLSAEQEAQRIADLDYTQTRIRMAERR